MLKIFDGSNGKETFQLKCYGDCVVPEGYYNESDAYGRRLQFLKLVGCSINPLLGRFIDEEISKYFYTEKHSFKGEVLILPFWEKLEANSIDEALRTIIEDKDPQHLYHNEIIININFETSRPGCLNKCYGWQISIIIGDETIYDPGSEDEFQIWYLYMGGEKTNLDTPFTEEQENKIIGHFLGYLWQSEEPPKTDLL